MAAEDAVRFRVAAHGLDRRRSAQTPLAAVTTVALPDYPKGAALRGLAARRAGVDERTLGSALASGDLVRALSLRGTTHVFAADDVAVFTTGVLPAPGDEDACRVALGSAWPVFDELGVDAVDAISRGRDEIADVAAGGGGGGWTKGEISEALHGRLPRAWEPRCERCRAHHVPDLLFRLSAIAAGLRFAGEGPRLVPGSGSGSGSSWPPGADDHEGARRELVTRFLGAYAPATAQAFADWCGIGLTESKASFAALGEEIVPVRLDGRSAHALARDIDRLQDPPPVEGVRLVPAGDAFLQQRDRATLVSDPARRRSLWRPAGSPGLVLVDGVAAGVWRHKQTKEGLVVTVDGWIDRLDRLRSAVEEEASIQAATHTIGGDHVEVELNL